MSNSLIGLRATGGTEYAVAQLTKRIPLPEFSISISDVNKKADVLWMHQAHDQPCVQNLKYTQDNFKKIVFVSDWQSSMFQKYLEIRPNKCIVIGNGVNPLPIYTKPTDCINLFYSSTPFRGLDVLIESFRQLELPNVYLHIFTGMGIYGRSDEPYLKLYESSKRIPNIRFYGAVAPTFLHEWIARYGHIFTYPNTWEETYCIAAHEAMSGRAIILTPDLGTLNSTCPNSHSYEYTKDKIKHSQIFIQRLKHLIEFYPEYTMVLEEQKKYADGLNWDYRATQWLDLFSKIKYE